MGPERLGMGPRCQEGREVTEPLDPSEVYGPHPAPIVDTDPDTSVEEYWREVGNAGVDVWSGR